METFQTLPEIVLEARRRLPPEIWDFVIGATESETTARRNRRSLDCLAFQPRVLRDVSRIDASTTLLGHPLRIPVVLAPIGSIALLDPGGALTAAKAAEAFGVIGFMSGVADPGAQQVSSGSHAPLVFTIYVNGDREWLMHTVDHVQSLGFRAIALLADTAYYSRRDRDLMNRLQSKGTRRISYAELQRRAADSAVPEAEDAGLYAASVTWNTLSEVVRRSDLPALVKGVMSAETAQRALAHGADAIYVSNHGGRQLDHLRSTIDVLPAVIDAVAGRAEVIVDGGCLRGTDVLKALALGAKAVGIGRLQALALAAGGAPALIRALELLEEELIVNMGLLGVTKVAELDASYLCRATPVGPSHVLGAYPVVLEALDTLGSG